MQRRVERIERWLGEELPKLHELVVALEAAAQAQASAGSAYILVAESATNVYRGFQQVSLAADAYRQSVRKPPGG